jgi:hypothetical protein
VPLRLAVRLKKHDDDGRFADTIDHHLLPLCSGIEALRTWNDRFLRTGTRARFEHPTPSTRRLLSKTKRLWKGVCVVIDNGDMAADQSTDGSEESETDINSTDRNKQADVLATSNTNADMSRIRIPRNSKRNDTDTITKSNRTSKSSSKSSRQSSRRSSVDMNHGATNTDVSIKITVTTSKTETVT